MKRPPFDRKGDVVSINTVWMGTTERSRPEALLPSEIHRTTRRAVPSGKSRS